MLIFGTAINGKLSHARKIFKYWRKEENSMYRENDMLISNKTKKSYYAVVQTISDSSLIFRGNYIAGQGYLYYYESLQTYSDGDVDLEQSFRFEWNKVSDRIEIFDDDGFGVDVNVEKLLSDLKIQEEQWKRV